MKHVFSTEPSNLLPIALYGCHGSQFKFSHQQTVPLKPDLMLQVSAVFQYIMQNRLPTIICCPVFSFIREEVHNTDKEL